MYTAHSESVSQSGVFTAVCDSLRPTVSSVRCYGCRRQTNQPTACRAAVEMHGRKKRRRNAADFKRLERLGYQQVLGYPHTSLH